MKKTKTAYLNPDLNNKPFPLSQVLADASFEAFRSFGHYTETHPAKGRRKVRITVTVEAVE
jgi:hypothetical protein